MRAFSQFSIRYQNGELQILDQVMLPDEERWLTARDHKDMIVYIKRLSVRGAPMIGVAASLSLAEAAARGGHTEAQLREIGAELRASRPTAVNLMHCIDRLLPAGRPVEAARLVEEAYQILADEVAMNKRMAALGAAMVQEGEGILTHCNTGSLATPGVGTALGVIREAFAAGKKIHVYVDETRPLLQGGRLTAYELKKEGIPYTLICDNMAASLMRAGKIQRVFVGADRICANGDFANKIGTYGVAVLAKYHNIPFHCVAPLSTVDLHCVSGEHIEIEQRPAHEVQGVSGSFGSTRWAPADAAVHNPAFDVTPGDLVTSHVLDTGVYTTAQVSQGILTTLK
jgi:methylthioribose-1-phosphate isomerase